MVIAASAESKPKTVILGGDADSREYVVRATWLPSGTGLLIQTMNRAQTKITVHRANLDDIDVAGNIKSRILFEETDPGWVHPHDDLIVSPDEKQFLWVSERSGFAHLYLYNMNGELVRQVTKGDFSLRDAGTVYWLRQAVKAVDWENGVAYVSSLKKSSIENHLYRVDLANGEMTRLSQEDGTHSILFDKSGQHFVDEWSTAASAPKKTVHKANGEAVHTLITPNMETAKKFDLQYPEFFTIATKDGFEMPAFIMKPKDFDPTKKYPVITYGYGGPSAPSVANKWDARDIFWRNLLLQKWLPRLLCRQPQRRSDFEEGRKFSYQ